MKKQLDSAVISTEVECIKTLILENVRPLELYLFGSAASGKMTDHSDYDFLIVIEDGLNCKIPMKRYFSCRSRMPRRPIDIVWMSKSEFDQKKYEGGIAFIAFQDGKKLI